MLNKIPVINSYIREQEKGNVQFVTQNNLGIYEPQHRKMALLVHKMLEDNLESYHQRISNMQLKNGTQEIAEYILHST